MSVSSQAPPINLYNHSFGTHRQNDSSASSSSVAMSYARHGANSGMVAWRRHRKEISIDSIDDEQRSQEDSLFEKSHCRSSMSSDSLFGEDYHLKNGLLPPNPFRPVSVRSIERIHSPVK